MVPLEPSVPTKLNAIYVEMVKDSGYKTPITRNSFGYLGLDGWKTLKY